MFAAILIFLSSFNVNAQKLNTYSDNRIKADMDPRTLNARRDFSLLMESEIECINIEFNSSYKLNIHTRMISQFGRGYKSAILVLPDELHRIIQVVESIKNYPNSSYEFIRHDKRLSKFTQKQKLDVILELANIKVINLDYWGYMTKSEILPEYTKKKNSITYYAHWLELKDKYKGKDANYIKKSILVGAIINYYKPWYDIF